MILNAISFQGKSFEALPLESKENAHFDIKRARQKGHFRSFAEMGRGLDLQVPP